MTESVSPAEFTLGPVEPFSVAVREARRSGFDFTDLHEVRLGIQLQLDRIRPFLCKAVFDFQLPTFDALEKRAAAARKAGKITTTDEGGASQGAVTAAITAELQPLSPSELQRLILVSGAMKAKIVAFQSQITLFAVGVSLFGDRLHQIEIAAQRRLDDLDRQAAASPTDLKGEPAHPKGLKGLKAPAPLKPK